MLININVGVLGHVDSGKTSLVKALSTNLSTAALDKHPQARERGITLDLGFSSFTMPVPERLRADADSRGATGLQLTLVDCPGHASLIRTIIGGAQIIDLVILVIDVMHGIQAQTVECVIIAEITTSAMIIVLNKVDMIPEGDREQRVKDVRMVVRRSLKGSRFVKAPIVAMSAAVNGEKVAALSRGRAAAVTDSGQVMGLEQLKLALAETAHIPTRSASGPLYMAIDHCFPIKGQGTVLTGTILSGGISVGDLVELPELGEEKKVKSMQMFHQPVRTAVQGDRVGVCVTNLDPKTIERGIVAAPASICAIRCGIAVVKKVRAFRDTVKTGSKLHISVGHVTVMARVTFFGAEELKPCAQTTNEVFGNSTTASLSTDVARDLPHLPMLWDRDYAFQDELRGREEWGEDGHSRDGADYGGGAGRRFVVQYALLEFDSSVMCPLHSLVLGSRLDTETGAASPCRIAMYGTLVEAVKDEKELSRLRVYKDKVKEGSVYRMVEKMGEAEGQEVYRELTGQNLFKKETDLTAFIGMRVETADGQVGVIESGFGRTGKFKVSFSRGVRGVKPGDRLFLRFSKYMYDTKRMVQREVAPQQSTASPGLPIPPPAADEALSTELRIEGSSPPPLPAPETPALTWCVAPSNTAGGGEMETTDDGAGERDVEIRQGQVDAVKPGDIAIVSGLFTMEEDIGREFVGLRVSLAESGDAHDGCIIGPFGKAGKCKVQFNSTFCGPVGAKVMFIKPTAARHKEKAEAT